jgi:hypothetical protein
VTTSCRPIYRRLDRRAGQGQATQDRLASADAAVGARDPGRKPVFRRAARAYFTRCPVARIADDPELFARCLDQSTQQEQADLLSSLYPDYQLESKYEAVTGSSSSALAYRPRFRRTRLDDDPVTGTQRFRQWALIDRLMQHIRDQKRKHLFYKPLLMQIQGYELLDAQTLALEFEHFTIVDHQDFSHRVICYDRPYYQKKRAEHTPADELSMPWNGIPTARESILLKLKTDKAVLMLDEINLLYARDFIDEKANRAEEIGHLIKMIPIKCHLV